MKLNINILPLISLNKLEINTVLYTFALVLLALFCALNFKFLALGVLMHLIKSLTFIYLL